MELFFSLLFIIIIFNFNRALKILIGYFLLHAILIMKCFHHNNIVILKYKFVFLLINLFFLMKLLGDVRSLLGIPRPISMGSTYRVYSHQLNDTHSLSKMFDARHQIETTVSTVQPITQKKVQEYSHM